MNPNALQLPVLDRLPHAVVLDLDGTLFDPAGTVTPRSAAALRWLLDRDVHVVIATARPLRSVRARVGTALTDQMSVIHMNGAGLVHRGTPRARPVSRAMS